MPKVSVIIPSYNHDRFIKECIESVLNQTFQDFEIIITDDGSTDRTIEIIQSFTDARIHLFRHSENKGAAIAMNHCILNAAGEYIAPLRSDDAWYPEKLALQVRYLDEHPDIAVVFSKVDWVNESGNLIEGSQNPYKDLFDLQNRTRFEWLNYFFKQGNCLNMSSSLIRRKCFTEIGVQNPVFAGLYDFDFWVRICLVYDIAILDEKLVRYRGMNDHSNPSADNPRSRARNRFEYKQLLNQYLRITNVQELLLVFPEAARYGAISQDLIPYFLGRVAIDKEMDFTTLWGLEVIYDLLKNEKIALKLEKECDFTYRDFIKLTGQLDIFNLATIGQQATIIKEGNAAIVERDAAIKERDAHLALIYESRVWQLATFLSRARVWVAPYGSRRERLGQLGLRAIQVLRRDGLAGFIKKVFRRDSINYSPPEDIKQKAEDIAKSRLDTFLSSDAIVDLPVFSQPVVSIILLFYNRAEMSLQCLETLADGARHIPFEVVIVDNASTDQTSLLLDRVRNARIIHNDINNGFGGGCNQAADLAIGKYLLFLNNDTQLLPDSLKVLIETIEGGKNIGAVGGKLIFPNGRLQEAGSIIWQDGSCLGYGRNDDPSKPEYSYQKDVDFCSGALLLTPRDLFLSLGRFDPRYAPAYYEDADYCLQLWNKGYRVVYQPFAAAIHYEFGSSGQTIAIALQTENRKKFVEKWQDALPNFYQPAPTNIIFSREHGTASKRILYIDDRIPDYRLGSGFPRTYRILITLAEMGYKLTFLPLQTPELVVDITQTLQMKGIEVLYIKEEGRKIDFKAFLKARPTYYDIIFVSRPHNLQEIKQNIKDYAEQAAVVYDAEALFSFRELKFNELRGRHLIEAEKKKLIENEVTLVKEANVVTAVSPMEKELFEKYGAPCVHILSHVVESEPTPADFEERKDILFVGSILTSPSPNEDAVLYFVKQILPFVRQELQCEFYIVGSNRVRAIWELRSDFVHVIGKVEDLTSFYNRCRLFVAPSRYAAGIPLKMLDAAAHGLPGVVTPLLADQLGWQENRDLLIGRNPEEFARKTIALYSDRNLFYSLRQNALERIREEYSPQRFAKNLEDVIGLATKTRSD